MRKMRNILKNRLALSTVITTLIILVVSVLLAGVVTYFAINVVSTRSQQESLSLSYQHVWVNSAGSEAAIMITNTGGRDVVIQQIQIRGQACTAAGILTPVAADMSIDLTYVTNAVTGTPTGYAEALAAPTGTTLVLKSRLASLFTLLHLTASDSTT